MGNFELDLINFQSIGKANLEFIPGINLIVGQSNSGKTAILRAIKAVLTNPSRAKYYIKKGTSETIVTIDTGDNTFIWSRSEKGSKYIVNDEEYSKLGTKGLFDLIERNGFVQDDKGIVMNIEGEWDLPFPFDKSPSDLFRLFENIFCVSDSAVILKSYKDDEAALVREKAVLNGSKERLQMKLKALDELEAEVELDRITEELAKFEEDASTLFNGKKDITEVERDSQISNITLDDVVPPEVYSLQEWTQGMADYNFIGNVGKRVKFYSTLPATLEVPQTLTECMEMESAYKTAEIASKLSTIDLSMECEVGGENYTDIYTDMLPDLSFIERAYKISTEIDLSKECEVFNTISTYTQMLDDYSHIIKCCKQAQATKERYEAVCNNLKAYQEQLSQFTICPLCGHELEGDECLSPE